MYFLAEQIMISIRKRREKVKGKIMGGKVLHPEEKSLGWKKFMLRI